MEADKRIPWYKRMYRAAREVEWSWSLLGYLGFGGKVTTILSGFLTAAVAWLQGYGALGVIAAGMFVAACATIVVAGARAPRPALPINDQRMLPSARPTPTADKERRNRAQQIIRGFPDPERNLLRSLLESPRPRLPSEDRAFRSLRQAQLIEKIHDVGEEDRNIWDVAPDVRDLAEDLLGAMETAETATQETGPIPFIERYGVDSPPRIRVRNRGEHGTFSAQCRIIRGNTGERDVPLRSVWEPGDIEGSVEIGAGQYQDLRILRDQVRPEIPFTNVQVMEDTTIQSSTGGEMPYPAEPWIEIEVSISAGGHPTIHRFLWFSETEFWCVYPGGLKP